RPDPVPLERGGILRQIVVRPEAGEVRVRVPLDGVVPLGEEPDPRGGRASLPPDEDFETLAPVEGRVVRSPECRGEGSGKALRPRPLGGGLHPPEDRERFGTTRRLPEKAELPARPAIREPVSDLRAE